MWENCLLVSLNIFWKKVISSVKIKVSKEANALLGFRATRYLKNKKKINVRVIIQLRLLKKLGEIAFSPQKYIEKDLQNQIRKDAEGIYYNCNNMNFVYQRSQAMR